MTVAAEAAEQRRRLPVWALVPLFLAFLLVPQIISLFVFGVDAFDASYVDTESALATEVVPDGGDALIATVVILLLGWAGLVWRERLRTRAWVWVVPISVVGLSLAITDYAHLGRVATVLVVALVVGTSTTGLGEELMFRGIALQSLRVRVSEGWAAFWTTVFFGSAHLVNVVVIGAAAIVQALLALPIGYLIYLGRRVSGGIVIPIGMHWLYDFSIFSQTVGTDGSAAGGFHLLVLTILLRFLVAVLRRRINPAQPDALS